MKCTRNINSCQWTKWDLKKSSVLLAIFSLSQTGWSNKRYYLVHLVTWTHGHLTSVHLLQEYKIFCGSHLQTTSIYSVLSMLKIVNKTQTQNIFLKQILGLQGLSLLPTCQMLCISTVYLNIRGGGIVIKEIITRSSGITAGKCMSKVVLSLLLHLRNKVQSIRKLCAQQDSVIGAQAG